MCSGARNRGLTWEAAAEHARSLGALLPTRDDLKRAKASGEITASLPGRDIWLPVRRADGIEGDWCAPNNEAIGSYNSHLDRHRQIPGWGSDGGGHKHIPGTHGAQLPFFFLVKQPPGYSGGKMTAAALGNGGYVDRAKLLALSPGGEPLTASAAVQALIANEAESGALAGMPAQLLGWSRTPWLGLVGWPAAARLPGGSVGRLVGWLDGWLAGWSVR